MSGSTTDHPETDSEESGDGPVATGTTMATPTSTKVASGTDSTAENGTTTKI